MVVAASRNHLYRRRLQVVIDAGPRNHLYLLGQQVKIRSSPRNQYNNPKTKQIKHSLTASGKWMLSAEWSGMPVRATSLISRRWRHRNGTSGCQMSRRQRARWCIK